MLTFALEKNQLSFFLTLNIYDLSIDWVSQIQRIIFRSLPVFDYVHFYP